MWIEGLNRRPRRGEPGPEDIAHVWRQLSFRRKAEVTRAACEESITIEMLIRRRFAVCARVIFGPRQSGIGVVEKSPPTIHPPADRFGSGSAYNGNRE